MLFQFWFNTFFVSQEAAAKEIYEDEPTLKTFDFGKGLRYFETVSYTHLTLPTKLEV